MIEEESQERKIKQYKEHNCVKLSIKNCSTIQYANRNIKKNLYDDKHLYSYVKYSVRMQEWRMENMPPKVKVRVRINGMMLFLAFTET